MYNLLFKNVSQCIVSECVNCESMFLCVLYNKHRDGVNEKRKCWVANSESATK